MRSERDSPPPTKLRVGSHTLRARTKFKYRLAGLLNRRIKLEKLQQNQVKKRGRRPKNQKKEYILNEDQSKFFIDLSNEKDSLDLIFSLLKKCNKKDYGREITFKDLCIYSLSKLADKDIEKIQELSLSEMEKVQRTLDEYNKRNSTNLTLGEFLVKKLGIN